MAMGELADQHAAAFKARIRGRAPKEKRAQPGYSGPQGVVRLPAEIVDDMDAAINEAFEQLEVERVDVDEQSTF